ncbi:hypothetical protein V2A60_008816 [Cordyceps javanica]
MVQSALEPTEEDETISFLAEALQYHTLCHLHRAWPDRQQDDWKSRIQRFRETCEDELDASNNEKSVSQATTEDLFDQGKTCITSTKAKDSQRPRRLLGHMVFETSGFAFIGRGDMTDEDKLVADEMRDIACEPLNTEDDKSKNEVYDGFIYLYKVPGNDHLVKIGFTTDSVDAHSRERVPHAHRVERLVHAEPMERRVRHYCERCTAQHVECFEAEVDEAAAMMDKWSRWMRMRPY